MLVQRTQGRGSPPAQKTPFLHVYPSLSSWLPHLAGPYCVAGLADGRAIVSIPCACTLAQQRWRWTLLWMASQEQSVGPGEQWALLPFPNKRKNSVLMRAMMFILKGEGWRNSEDDCLCGWLQSDGQREFKDDIYSEAKNGSFSVFHHTSLFCVVCTIAAVPSSGLYILCLCLLCRLLFSFVGKVKLKQISCFLLIPHQQDLSLLWSATGIRN